LDSIICIQFEQTKAPLPSWGQNHFTIIPSPNTKRCNYPNSLTDKEKAIISDGLSSFAPLTDERCNYNAIIEFFTIKKLKG
jgi:hypothetical protein